MASTCSVCPRGKNSKPSAWCLDCNDLLCQSCTRHHTRSSASRNHKVMPYEEYQKLPPFILKIRPYCTEHNKKYTNFCRKHDTPICIKCLKQNHKKCKDVLKIEDIVHRVKDSVLFEDTMLDMETKCEILKEIAVDRNKNLKQLNIKCNEMKAEFEEKIENLIKHLKNLKDKTLSEMDSVYNELANDLTSTLKTVQSKEKELQAILDQKDDILKCATNYQTLIGIKEMETIVNEVNTYLKELYKDEKLLEYDIKLHVNKTTEDLVSGIQSFGDMQVTKSPSAVSVQNTGARYLEAVKEIHTSPVQLQLQQTVGLKDHHHRYYDCCTLPSGLVLFSGFVGFSSDERKFTVLIHRSDGSLRSTIEFDKSDGVWHVTPVDDHHVAVSHYMSGTISIIDVDSDQVVKKLKVGENVYGLCCRGRDIVCCIEGRGLARVHIDSGKVKTGVRDKSADYLSHIEVSDSIICYTCPDKHTVTVLDTKYKVIFKYKDETALSFPTGVTIDDHHIYVTGYLSNNLVMISPNGKTCHQLLGKDDGLYGPTAVHYNDSTKKLVVIYKHEHAFLYST